MTGANYMGGKRNAAKFRLKDPTAVAQRHHFGKRRQKVGFGILSLSLQSGTAASQATDGPHQFEKKPGRDDIAFKHAKKDMHLHKEDFDSCFRSVSSPSSHRGGSSVSSVYGMQTKTKSPAPRSRLLDALDRDDPESYQLKINRILSIPDFAGLDYLRANKWTSSEEAAVDENENSSDKPERYPNTSDSSPHSPESTKSDSLRYVSPAIETPIDKLVTKRKQIDEGHPTTDQEPKRPRVVPDLQQAERCTSNAISSIQTRTDKENFAPLVTTQSIEAIKHYRSSSSFVPLASRPDIDEKVNEIKPPGLLERYADSPFKYSLDAPHQSDYVDSLEAFAPTRLPSPHSIHTPSNYANNSPFPSSRDFSTPVSVNASRGLSMSRGSSTFSSFGRSKLRTPSSNPFMHPPINHRSQRPSVQHIYNDSLPPSSLPSYSDDLDSSFVELRNTSRDDTPLSFSLDPPPAKRSEIHDLEPITFEEDPYIRAVRMLGLDYKYPGLLEDHDDAFPFGRINADSRAGVGCGTPEREAGYLDHNRRVLQSSAVSPMKCSNDVSFSPISPNQVDYVPSYGEHIQLETPHGLGATPTVDNFPSELIGWSSPSPPSHLTSPNMSLWINSQATCVEPEMTLSQLQDHERERFDSGGMDVCDSPDVSVDEDPSSPEMAHKEAASVVGDPAQLVCSTTQLAETQPCLMRQSADGKKSVKAHSPTLEVTASRDNSAKFSIRPEDRTNDIEAKPFSAQSETTFTNDSRDIRDGDLPSATAQVTASETKPGNATETVPASQPLCLSQSIIFRGPALFDDFDCPDDY